MADEPKDDGASRPPSDDARRSPAPDTPPNDSKSPRASEDPAPKPSSEETESAPPLPDEAPPGDASDDGWDYAWDNNAGAFYYFNKYTGRSQWENPRMSQVNHESSSSGASAPGTAAPPRVLHGGYNPAIHGSYDPNADYAIEARKQEEAEQAAAEAAVEAAAAGLTNVNQGYGQDLHFNRFTGKFQEASVNPENHNDYNKSGRQMRAFFDIDAAANSHDGRSLKAERRGKSLSKKELQQYKEKRREKKEEKRRAWLRD
ncbi:hypothetical protein BS50DRAFT_16018 [Corynespora cassiicola Philippines]|uniref:WW domain-containing protein n=1 Tax=Corynespora cassiicola Philippines TaxID=1448308 RepID=A0A2T2P9U6_CORCC|nr:hypothetical protein BS50DRAFT_16018 [Corynespora cassiicola Philippines]